MGIRVDWDLFQVNLKLKFNTNHYRMVPNRCWRLERIPATYEEGVVFPLNYGMDSLTWGRWEGNDKSSVPGTQHFEVPLRVHTAPSWMGLIPSILEARAAL